MLKNKINKSFSKKYPLEIEDIDDLEIGKR